MLQTLSGYKKYSHLTLKDRIKIEILSFLNKTQTEIAAAVGCSQSTVSRELRRNQPPKNKVKYNSEQAHNRSDERKRNSAKKERLKNHVIREYVHDKIKIGWSPEQIVGRIRLEHSLKTNHESIYQYIYNEKTDMIQYLPKRHRKRKKRGLKVKNRVGKIPNRISITERPEIVNRRIRIGDLEIDTMGSRKAKECLQVIVDRVTHYTTINLLKDKSTGEMMDNAIKSLEKMPSEFKRTITFDNGTENAAHERLRELGIETYFCHPYHSWEKGTVENTIGLIRRVFPKSTNFSRVSNEQIKELENKLNNRPRKCLNFMTANEVMKLCTS
ncbi:MAG: IS30 family transposase [Methanimicrococcus sp.]|nr:IS30 family transposase [Methanimicrococcus sp.]